MKHSSGKVPATKHSGSSGSSGGSGGSGGSSGGSGGSGGSSKQQQQAATTEGARQTDLRRIGFIHGAWRDAYKLRREGAVDRHLLGLHAQRILRATKHH